MISIDGKATATTIYEELKSEIAPLQQKPCVCFVRVGEDPASISYLNKKQKVASDLGIQSHLHALDASISQDALLERITDLNADSSVHGILVQSPLPEHLAEHEVFNAVSPAKDVDGFHSVSLGKLIQEDSDGFIPCTPGGIIELLSRYEIQTEAKHVVILGRSTIVGKPLAQLLCRKHKNGNATVTLCHSRTKDVTQLTQQADILIAAIGKPGYVSENMVREETTVIDVGINRIEDPSRKSGYRLVGDVDYDGVKSKCSHITPVPGGVGPMTVAMLMKNTIRAYKSQVF